MDFRNVKQSHFTRVEDSLLSELECPVCTDYLRPPITFCVNGHNICNICRPKVQHCPTCRQQLLNTRNVALERLAREANYPCKYRKYGCKEVCSLDLIGEHQGKCQYIPQACLVHKLNLGICTWTGTASDVKTHLKHAHSDVCMDYYGCTSCHDRGSFLISGVTPAAKYCKLIFS
jgi:E3 ubiquitin-protein ligase SIAH1